MISNLDTETHFRSSATHTWHAWRGGSSEWAPCPRSHEGLATGHTGASPTLRCWRHARRRWQIVYCVQTIRVIEKVIHLRGERLACWRHTWLLHDSSTHHR